MKYEDFINWSNYRETLPMIKENLIAFKVIQEYLSNSFNHKYNINNAPNYVLELLYNYSLISDDVNKQIINKILTNYNFNYSISIHNAIYSLLNLEESNLIAPLSWPGIENIDYKENSYYTLNTTLGTIKVFKASKIFSKTRSSIIFAKKKLIGECYARTYDFIKQNKEYNAIISYMPNFFYGRHYHAYIENNKEVIDIAANAYYNSKSFSNKTLCGNIITKLSYEKIEEEFGKIINKIPEFKKEDKLHILALYYDHKMNN